MPFRLPARRIARWPARDPCAYFSGRRYRSFRESDCSIEPYPPLLLGLRGGASSVAHTRAGTYEKSVSKCKAPRGPGSTAISGALKVQQRDDGHAKRLRDPEQIQVRRIAPAGFQTAYVGSVQVAFSCQFLLRPASGETKAPNPLAEFSESGMRSGAWRHAPMVTMGHIVVYRPGSTHAGRLAGLSSDVRVTHGCPAVTRRQTSTSRKAAREGRDCNDQNGQCGPVPSVSAKPARATSPRIKNSAKRGLRNWTRYLRNPDPAGRRPPRRIRRAAIPRSPASS